MSLFSSSYFDQLHHKFHRSIKGSELIFNSLKDEFKTRIKQIIYDRKIKNRGPKIKVDLDRILDAIFESLDNGTKSHYINKNYSISISTFFWYRNLIAKNKIFEQVFEQFLLSQNNPKELLTDTMTVTSYTGKESTGFSYKVKGKRTIKIALLADRDKIIFRYLVVAGNIDDRATLSQMIRSMSTGSPDNPIIILADAGYVGKQITADCLDHKIRLIAAPKRLVNGKPSHILNTIDKFILKSNRPRIEHVNQQLKNFRAIAHKYVRKISLYCSMLSLAILICSISYYSRKSPKKKLNLTRKIY